MSKRSKKPGSILKEDPHNYGIDLLRCLSMLMVVNLHLLNQGGAASVIRRAGSVNSAICTFLQFFCLGAVNIYGMISGYVMLNGSFKLRRFFSLWLQVFFVAVMGCVLFSIICPAQMQGSYWIKALLPVSQRLYWYFTCYAGVFLLSPVINRGIRALTDRQAVCLLIGCIFLFCIVAAIGYTYNGDAFYLVGGYSVLWLLTLYVIGACLKKTGLLLHTKTWKLLLVMAVCFALNCLLKYGKMPAFFKDVKSVTGKYINPLLVVFDICLFALFARIEFRGRAFKRLLSFTAPLTFTVYLLHLHPVVWEFLKDRLLFIGNFSSWTLLPFVLALALAVFIAGVAIDWLRLQLFRLLRVDRICAALETFLRKIFNKFTRFLLKRS